jgi:hypothetical protein
MRWLKGVGMLMAVGLCLFAVACGGERAAAAAKEETLPPPGLIEALKGHQTGDLLPTNNAAFQLQLSRFPWRYVVRMNAPREAVAPAVDAYFRNLGVDDMASLGLMWCETLKREGQDIWSCSK